MSDQPPRPRYSSAPLPPYSYVPGHAPHPVSDPAGHLYGQPHAAPPPLDPEKWQASAAYRYGVDLVNYGYYWEAHEAWESLWHAAGRAGAVAAWLKSLIKLTAACVKAREGNPVGVARHAGRSLELLAEVQSTLPADEPNYCGIALAEVRCATDELKTAAAADYTAPQPTLLLPWRLTLDLRGPDAGV